MRLLCPHSAVPDAGFRLQAWWDLQPSAATAADPSCVRALQLRGLNPAALPEGPLLIRSMQGHTNAKNFVGLSVREADGLIACGSECGCALAERLFVCAASAAAAHHVQVLQLLRALAE